MTFKEQIKEGIPKVIPEKKELSSYISRAPKRKDILTKDEKKLALINALRYFPKHQHTELLEEFKDELNTYGRIYMYRLIPDYKIHSRHIDEYPGESLQAKSIMLMIQNNLDENR